MSTRVNGIDAIELLARGRAALLCAICLACVPALAADVRLLAPNAVREAVVPAIAAFEQSTGHKVMAAWAGSEAITKRVADGEAVDVVVNPVPSVERLTADGRLVAGTRTEFARSAIGVAAGPGVARPDVSSVAALKMALLSAKSILISSGTSGRYLENLFVRLGVAEQIEARVKQLPSGAQVSELLARGEADLGFQQVSELAHATGIQYLGPIPAEVQSYTVWAGAVHVDARNREAAEALLQALRRPETAAEVRKVGLEPL